ncbi:MAG: tRNA epoxyqueuosine(34) reductase QueG [Gammaproteobacteria bacterium]
MPTLSDASLSDLCRQIKRWSFELGFQQTGVSDTRLREAERHLSNWLSAGFHGDMAFMEKHGLKRSRPELLQPGTVRVISVRMDYLPEPHAKMNRALEEPERAFISRYALGRDYHKTLRKKLQTLCRQIHACIGEFGYRVYVDSAPVLEKALAEKAGLGWIGKHSNLINRKAGSWFFLGEIYTDLPLPCDEPGSSHCGSCSACIDICPTRAIVAPYRVDARRCISYLTIELDGAIPMEFRPLLGNRIYGCDDCQLVCPWNKFAHLSAEKDFEPRHRLDSAELIRLFLWNEKEFLDKTEGSAIRRIGHVKWLRNIAVALGNAPNTQAVRDALAARLSHPSDLVKEHVLWAIDRHRPTDKTG